MQLNIMTHDDLQQVNEKLEQVLQLLGSAPTGGNKIYTTQELADTLQVSIKTIQNWRETRLIEFSQVGHKIFYTQLAVDEFLSNHSIKRFSKTFFNQKKKEYEK